MMKPTAIVQIIGAPIACKDGVKDSWHDAADWAARTLEARFGEAVQFQYFDLFDPACPSMPPGAQLPLVLVNNEVLISGGKISIPIIKKRLQELGL